MFVVYTIVILCVLILVHEFGHFIVAKMNGIYVEEFALGMGPKIIQWGKKETRYSIRLFPIGGYCKMRGEDDESEDPRAFCRKTVLQRMAVVFCGPAMNFIAAIVFFMIAFMYFGIPMVDPVISDVLPDSPAAVAGIKANDEIISIDGKTIEDWNGLAGTIQSKTGQKMTLQVERQGESFQANVTPKPNEEGVGMIGIIRGKEHVGFFSSIELGFRQTYDFTKLLIVSIGQMITGEMPVDVGGPVQIAAIVDDFAQQGLMNLFLLAGVLSINLGVMNLLPIPALDGSRLVFLAIEGVRRKPIAAEKEAMVHFIGLIAMFGLMIFITYQDIAKLVGS